MTKVFLSYGHEDLDSARKIYEQLKSVTGVEPWFDKECLTPGMKWKPEIRKAIRESDFFIVLLSKETTTRRGFVHSELVSALEVMEEFPEGRIFLIPVRLNDCEIPFERLRDIQYADFFPSWENGYSRVLRSIHTKLPANPANKEETLVERHELTAYHYRVGLLDTDMEILKFSSLIQKLNRIQNYFYFTSPKLSQLDVVHDIDGFLNFDIHKIPTAFYSERSNLLVDLVVCLTKYPLAFQEDGLTYSNYFSGPGEIDERFIFVSTHQLGEFANDAGRSFEKAVIYSMVSQLIVYFTDLGFHLDTRGCIMDFCRYRPDRVEGLRALRLCDRCKPHIQNQEFSRAIERILYEETI